MPEQSPGLPADAGYQASAPNPRTPAAVCDTSIKGAEDPAATTACTSVQTIKGDTPGAISIKVAPAPPPSGDEYPEIRAAVTRWVVSSA